MTVGPTRSTGRRPVRVVIADDHTLVRQSLIKLVEAEPGFEVIGDVDRGDAVVDAVTRGVPDIVLLDISMPNLDGIEVASELRRSSPEARILFLTAHDDDATVRRAVGIGADGYVSKTASTGELLQALRTVAAGGSFLSPSIARRVMEMASGREDEPARSLTEREMEILRLIATGMRPTDVAERLFLSVKTVKNHLTSIYAKLGVQTAAQAVAEAYRLGLVTTQQER